MDDSLQNIGTIHLIAYFCICTFYLISLLFSTRYKDFDKNSFYIFFGITFFMQLALNIADINNTNLCKNSSDISKATIVIMHTVIPWFFILGLGNLLLAVFPGCLRIFSNTIGMSIAYNFMYGETIKTAINTPLPETEQKKDEEYKVLLTKIVTDPKKLLNEIDILYKNSRELHDFYTEKLHKIAPNIFRLDGGDISEEQKKINKFSEIKIIDGKSKVVNITMQKTEYDILSLLKFKNDVGYAVWYILLGLISVLISTNSVLNTKCDAI